MNVNGFTGAAIPKKAVFSVALPPLQRLDDLLASAVARHLKVAVVMADEAHTLEALRMAHDHGLAEGLLIGNASEIRSRAEEVGLPSSAYHVIEEEDPYRAAMAAGQAVARGDAHLIMKGRISTGTLMGGLLQPDAQFRTGRRLSHVAVIESPARDRWLAVTDGAVHIAPDLAQKAEILQNAVDMVRALGVDEPRVAVLAALEQVNPEMPATVDAAALAKMAERGRFGRALVDGPLAADVALSVEAAEVKHVGGPVAGRAQVLIAPCIESANMLIKGLQYFAGARWGGLVVGGRVPVVVSSRADRLETRLYSLALGCRVA